MDVLFPVVGWLLEGLEISLFLQQVMMIDVIPVTGPSFFFTKRALLMSWRLKPET